MKTISHQEPILFTLVLWFLFDKYSWTNFKPYVLSFATSRTWLRQSNALERSANKTPNIWPLSLACFNFSNIDVISNNTWSEYYHLHSSQYWHRSKWKTNLPRLLCIINFLEAILLFWQEVIKKNRQLCKHIPFK